ncbi:MAG: hypothetical protein ACI9IP_003281 [Arcticibacterium sp.]|jgi:hypothetical protein
MKRRSLIKNLTLGVAASIALPSWAKNWSPSDLPVGQTLTSSDEALLIDVIDTLIPKTDTPGAKELGVEKYVKAMIATMHTKEEQATFYKGLPLVDAFAKRKYDSTFANLNPNSKVECLGMIEVNEEEKINSFFKTLKNYSVRGYTGSEWYMTEKAGYEYAPGYGYGCVDA